METGGGLPVEPGDLLHGDANGLVSIPHAIDGHVAARAAEFRQREHELVQFIKGADFTLNALAEREGW